LKDAHSEEPFLFLGALESYKEEFQKFQQQYSHFIRHDQVGLVHVLTSSLKNLTKEQEKEKLENAHLALCDLFQRVTNMVDLYIKPGANKQLNLAVAQTESAIQTVKEIANMIETFKPNNRRSKTMSSPLSDQEEEASFPSQLFTMLNPEYIFSKIENTINIDLKMDQFPRYARSQMLEKFLSQKGEDFTRSIAVNTAGYTADIRFKPNDFKSQLVTDRDLYFALALSEDTPDWKLIKTTEKPTRCNAYISKTPYVIGTTTDKLQGMKLFKVELYLPYSLEDVWNTYVDQESHFSLDPNLMRDLKLFKYVSPDKDAASQCLQNVNKVLKGGWDDKERLDVTKPPYAIQGVALGLDLMMGPFFKKRDFPHSMTTVYDPELDCIINTGHSAIFKERPIHKDRIEAQILFNYMFYRLGDKSTRFIHSMYSSLEVPVDSELILKKIWKNRAKVLQKGFLDILSRLTENGTKKVEKDQVVDDLLYFKALQENSEMYPNRSWYKELKQLKSK